MNLEDSLKADSVYVREVVYGKGRKKLRNESSWKKNVQKAARHTPKSLPKMPNCKHPANSCYQCASLTMQDIRKFHELFYKSKEKVNQDIFLLKNCSAKLPKKNRKPVRHETKFRKSVAIKYFIQTKRDGRFLKMQVCQKTIIRCLSISKFRLQNICRKYLYSGELPSELRGGDTKSQKYFVKKQAVAAFLKGLNPLQSHYCRNANVTKQYMPSNLNTKKLWKLYRSKNPENLVNYEFFRQIFTKKFNISFASPATDVCSRCLNFGVQIRQAKTQKEKIDAMTASRIHKVRANAFFESLRQNREDEITLSFDCQKNMVLPKIPDQQTYFSRQLYQYNFTICQGSSKSKQTPENTFTYTWNEIERPKGSNEIVSCVYHRLQLLNLTGINSVRLFCDGCGGQNKNRSMLGMLIKFFSEAPVSLKNIIITFPVPGHSFIPPDRVFGNIERIVNKEETILNPEEYLNIFARFGTVLQYLKDFTVLDWKQTSEKAFKTLQSWHFSFAPTKRFILSRNSAGTIVLRGEQFYKSDCGTNASIFKKGKSVLSIRPTELGLQKNVKQEKLQNVSKLLTLHFGADWKENPKLKYYVKAIQDENALDEPGEDLAQNELDEDELATEVPEEEELRV